MFSAISGLRGHQIMMDVIGNNIANVNTVGFKAGRVNFQDILSQTMRGASAPTTDLGSIDPAQVGLGMTVAGIDVLHTQGNLQSTGKNTDMAIQGDGFFILGNGLQNLYSRDGAFDRSLDGTLVNPASGLKVMGWPADSTGAVDATQPIGPLSIPIGQRTTAQASNTATVRGNLDASVPIGSTVSTTLSIYDSLGVQHSVSVTFKKESALGWSWTAAADPSDTAASTTSTGTLTFTSDGLIDTTSPGSDTLEVDLDSTLSGATSPMTFDEGGTPPTLDFTKMTQFSGNSEPIATANGFTSGTLIDFAVGSGGDITGVYSNGQTQKLGQIAIATFLNPAGLLRSGGNTFNVSSASGAANVGTPGTGARGTVSTGSLEMSNVDLATQFTGMITAERGFQANGRVITTSDEMLQELVNLKR